MSDITDRLRAANEQLRHELAEIGDSHLGHNAAEVITRLRAELDEQRMRADSWMDTAMERATVNADLLAALQSVLDDLDAYAAIGGARTMAHVEAIAVISKFDDAPSVSSVPDVFPRASGRSAVASPGGGGVGGVSVTSADVPKPAPDSDMWSGMRI